MLESASKEALYQQKLLELQNDLRQAKASLASTQMENERLVSVALEMKEVTLENVTHCDPLGEEEGEVVGRREGKGRRDASVVLIYP